MVVMVVAEGGRGGGSCDLGEGLEDRYLEQQHLERVISSGQGRYGWDLCSNRVLGHTHPQTGTDRHHVHISYCTYLLDIVFVSDPR